MSPDAADRRPSEAYPLASRSALNAIPLSATSEDINPLVMSMFADHSHAEVSDPGRVEGNVVLAYLDAFDPDSGFVDDLTKPHRHGGLGDVVVKRRLEEVLAALIAPIRSRRSELEGNRVSVAEVLREGRGRARETPEAELRDVRRALALSL